MRRKLREKKLLCYCILTEICLIFSIFCYPPFFFRLLCLSVVAPCLAVNWCEELSGSFCMLPHEGGKRRVFLFLQTCCIRKIHKTCLRSAEWRLRLHCWILTGFLLGLCDMALACARVMTVTILEDYVFLTRYNRDQTEAHTRVLLDKQKGHGRENQQLCKVAGYMGMYVWFVSK